VTLGFVPQGYTGEKLGVSLWSFQGPDERCLSFKDAYVLGGVSGDESYSNWITNGDLAWTISRAMAVLGLVFGAVALVCILTNLCGHEPHCVDVLAYTAFIALVCEAAKIGLFFSINLCRSQNQWYNGEKEEYSGSTSCGMSEGAFLCMGSIGVYFISTILFIGYFARPKIEDYNYDDNSLPEMTVMGKSLPTQKTSYMSSNYSQSHLEHRSEPISGIDNSFSSFSDPHLSRGPQAGLHSSNRSEPIPGMDNSFSSYNEPHLRRGPHMSRSYSSNPYSSERRYSRVKRGSYYNDAEEEEDSFDGLEPLPQFQRNPTARRTMDDVSQITFDCASSL
jgi:hypothetical protein